MLVFIGLKGWLCKPKPGLGVFFFKQKTHFTEKRPVILIEHLKFYAFALV